MNIQDPSLDRYRQLIDHLEPRKQPIDSQQALEILTARDALQIALEREKPVPIDLLDEVIELDTRFRDNAIEITKAINQNSAGELARWRESVKIVPAKGGKPSKGFMGNAIDFFSTLILGENASAQVVCHDGLSRSVMPGKSSVAQVCKNAKRMAVPIDESKTGDVRAFSKSDLSADIAEQIDRDIKNLQQQPIDNDAKGIAIAHLYRSKGLYKDAIDVLKKLITDGSQTTAVYQLLGSIYEERVMSDSAKIIYQTGFKLAKKEGNVEAQKYIQSRLTHILHQN